MPMEVWITYLREEFEQMMGYPMEESPEEYITWLEEQLYDKS